LDFAAEATDVRIAHVIGDDEQDTWLLVRRVSWGSAEQAYAKEG
jgi:hypothetical protein